MKKKVSSKVFEIVLGCEKESKTWFTNKQKQIKRTEENHLLIRCVQPVFSLPASFEGLLSSSSLLAPYILDNM